jgi:hypothetical protein
METSVKHSVSHIIYTLRSATLQIQNEKESRNYFDALDAGIADILSPAVGRTENQFLVADEHIPLYGVGATPEEAMDDYRSVVISYYESLEEDSSELDADLLFRLEILRQVFERTERTL